MLKNHFCFGLNGFEIIRYAMIFKYGCIDSKLTVLIIFAEKYIQSSEYIFKKTYITIYNLHLKRLNQDRIELQICTKLALELGER